MIDGWGEDGGTWIKRLVYGYKEWWLWLDFGLGAQG